MKKIALLLPVLFLAVSCDWFKLDNQEGWDASIEGKIVDSVTGETIQSEQGNPLTVYQLGWDNKVAQSWAIKNNGTFKNTLVFSGDYEMNSLKANFYAEPVSFSLKKGQNVQDLKAELFNLRFQLAINQLENPMRISAVKKDIARVKTILRENEIKSGINA